MDAFQIRLEEQSSSGNLVLKNGDIGLTPQGMFVVNFVSFYKKYYLNPSYLKEK